MDYGHASADPDAIRITTYAISYACEAPAVASHLKTAQWARNVFVSGHLIGWNSQGEVKNAGSIEMVQHHYKQDDIVYDASRQHSHGDWQASQQL